MHACMRACVRACRMEQQVHAELRDTFGRHGIGLSVSHIVSQFKEKGVYVTFAHPKYAELAYKKRELLRFRGKPLDAYIVKVSLCCV
jgi:hypothetical protein